MRIQHNISALNSYRQLGINNSAMAKNLEKLSSGYRINRAGDDAAGLAISEKMRAQIKGLETAQKNANDGISLVQTAEGALTEVHSMLNRMTELATQSANGTYDNEVDRANLQKEVTALLEEIDRISESTNFNGINLLDGSLSGEGYANVTLESAAGGKATDTEGTGAVYESAAVSGSGAAGDDIEYTVKYKDESGTEQEVTVTLEGKGSTTDTVNAGLIAEALNEKLGGLFKVKANGNKLEFTTEKHGLSTDEGMPAITSAGGAAVTSVKTQGKYDGVALDEAMAAGDRITVDGKTYTMLGTGGKTDADKGLFATQTDLIKQLQADGYKVVSSTAHGTAATNTLANMTIVREDGGNAGLKLQIGDTADDFNRLSVKVGDMGSAALGIDTVDIGNPESAAAAIDKIKNAINKVSSTRGDLGAVQNRLEHTINNLGVTTENITAAESRIRDTDMASEMMAFTKNNILNQAAQSMLAQANQVPQGVLQLLQ